MRECVPLTCVSHSLVEYVIPSKHKHLVTTGVNQLPIYIYIRERVLIQSAKTERLNLDWSSGQDTCLSRRWPGFDSPIESTTQSSEDYLEFNFCYAFVSTSLCRLAAIIQPGCMYYFASFPQSYKQIVQRNVSHFFSSLHSTGLRRLFCSDDAFHSETIACLVTNSTV